jgi:hypothetical protein
MFSVFDVSTIFASSKRISFMLGVCLSYGFIRLKILHDAIFTAVSFFANFIILFLVSTGIENVYFRIDANLSSCICDTAVSSYKNNFEIFNESIN